MLWKQISLKCYQFYIFNVIDFILLFDLVACGTPHSQQGTEAAPHSGTES